MANKLSNKNNYNSPIKITEILAAILSLSGITLAIFWLTGRSYASGFFSAMNIPDYLLNFTLYEYAEVSWFITISIVLIIFILACIVVIISELLRQYIINTIIPIIRKMLQKRRKTTKKKNKLPELSFYANILVGLIAISQFIIIILISQTLLYSFGEYNGKIRVMQSTMAVDITTTTPINIENLQIATNSNNEKFYSYKGMRLLIYNNGKYFLFQDIDPSTCKPKMVYIINEKDITLLNLYKADNVISVCN
jgi:hypothetical protein